MSEQTISCGRDLCVCESCGKRAEKPDELGELGLGLGPYPETIRLCPGCAEAHLRNQAEEYDEVYSHLEPRCTACGGDAERGYACPLAHIYPPGQCPEITGVY